MPHDRQPLPGAPWLGSSIPTVPHGTILLRGSKHRLLRCKGTLAYSRAMDVSDWRSVSQHYVQDLISKAVPNISNFDPTLLVLSCDDALAAARIIKADLKASTGREIHVLNHALQVIDEDSNPYMLHPKPYTGDFAGQRVLIVDKADNSRTTLSNFIKELQAGPAGAAQIGVFVLHNKRRPKAAELPEEVLNGRYFVGEEMDNVQIAFPFSVEFHSEQPQAHGMHASGAQRARRPSLEHPPRRPSPPPTSAQGDMVRAMSSHYIEQMLERAVDQQQLVQKFKPTMLVAASDGALPVARALRQYLRFKLHNNELPVLTPRLELYDEDTNPYLAHVSGVKAWGPSSLAGQHVLVVDRADNTRSTLAAFVSQLQQQAAAARQQVEEQGGTWSSDPVLGVFVLHNKKVDKQADLPADILADRYFFGEETEGIKIAYPFSVSDP